MQTRTIVEHLTAHDYSAGERKLRITRPDGRRRVMEVVSEHVVDMPSGDFRTLFLKGSQGGLYTLTVVAGATSLFYQSSGATVYGVTVEEAQ